MREGGRWVLAATILGSSMVWLESSALNVALDAIQQDLGATATELIWVVNIYLLLLAAFILISGSLGDHYGRKRIFGLGVVLFTLASATCGFAPTIPLLIAARAAQGFGGALLVPGSLAIITATIAEGDRGKAIGIWSSASAVTTLVGPVLGGFLASVGLWRGVFWLTIPFGLLVLLALARVPESRDEHAPRQLDYAGAVTLALALGALTFGALQLGEASGLTAQAWLPLTALAAGLAMLGVFVWVERRSDHPMVPLELFASRAFTGTNAMTACLYAGLGGALLFVPLNLIQVQGYSASTAGFATLTTSVLLAVLSPWAGGTLLERFGARTLLTIGPAAAGVGFALLALPGVTAGPGAYWWTFFPGLLVLGLGMGITVAPLTSTVMGAVSSEQSGVASGVNNAVTRTAQALATGLLGALIVVVFGRALGGALEGLQLPEEVAAQLQQGATQLGNTPVPEGVDGETHRAIEGAIKAAFVTGFRAVLAVAAGLAFLSATLSWWLLAPQGPSSCSNRIGDVTNHCSQRSSLQGDVDVHD